MPTRTSPTKKSSPASNSTNRTTTSLPRYHGKSIPIVPPLRVHTILFTYESVYAKVQSRLRRLIASYELSGARLDRLMNCYDDLFQATVRRLSNSDKCASSTGAAVQFATKVAEHLLIDSVKMCSRRSKSVLELTPRVNEEGEEDFSSWDFFSATATARRGAEDFEVRDLLDTATSKLTDLDAMDRAILSSLEDFVVRACALPNDRELAESIGAKQNTVTTRRHKLCRELQSKLRELRYAPAMRVGASNFRKPPGARRPHRPEMPDCTDQEHAC